MAEKPTTITNAPRARAPQVRTKPPRNWTQKFLEALSATCNVRASCQLAQVDKHTVYKLRHQDTPRGRAFAEAWLQALDDAADRVEQELHRRAVVGYEEPVFYQGEQCGTVIRYSDMLLHKLAIRLRPEVWSEKYRLEHSGPKGGPIQVDARAEVALLLAQMATRMNGGTQ